MSIISILCLINGFLNLFVGFFVLFNSKKRIEDIYFFFFTLSIAIWNEGYAFMYSEMNTGRALLMAKIGTVGIIFIPYWANMFVQAFLKKKERKLNIVITASVALLSVLLLSGWFYSDVTVRSWGNYPVANHLNALNIAFYIFLFYKIVFQLVVEYRKSSGIYRDRIFYLLLAFGLGSFGFIDWIPNYFYDFYPFAFALSSSWVIIIGYAIFASRLMDIDVIIRRGLLYTATTTVVTGLYVMAIYTSNFLFNRIPGFNVLWFMLPAIFILALLFQPIKNRLQEFIDRNFFKAKYEGDKIAHKFSDGVKKLMKTKELAEYISRAAMQTFKLFGSACFIYSEEKDLYICEDGRGTMAALKGASVEPGAAMISRMKQTGCLIVAEELQFQSDKTRRVKKDEAGDKEGARKVLSDMKSLGAVIAVPSISKKKEYRLIAFLAADRKKSEDAFSGSDIDLLENLAGQVSISIENAMLYKDQLKTIERSMSLEKLADLGRATAGVAGEAQSALSYIEWFSNQLPEKKNDPEFLLSQSRVLFSETEKMKLLMQGVLEYSRPSPMKIENIPLKRTAEDIMALMQEPAGKQGISIGLSCPDGLEVSADKNGLKQILLNLLMNAVEAAGQGGKVEIKALEEGGRTMIYVSDTGPGIPPQVRSRMFEPFYTTKEHGIGLGLSIVDQAVKAMGGAVTFDSGPGGGTTVKVELKR